MTRAQLRALIGCLILGGAAVAACDLQPQPLPPESNTVNSPAPGDDGNFGGSDKPTTAPSGDDAEATRGDAGDAASTCDDAGDAGEMLVADDGGC